MLVRCLILSSILADFLTRENREQGKEIQNSICRSGRDSTQHCYTRGEKREKPTTYRTIWHKFPQSHNLKDDKNCSLWQRAEVWQQVTTMNITAFTLQSINREETVIHEESPQGLLKRRPKCVILFSHSSYAAFKTFLFHWVESLLEIWSIKSSFTPTARNILWQIFKFNVFSYLISLDQCPSD